MKATLKMPFFAASSQPPLAILRTYGFEGVTFVPPAELRTEWLRHPLSFKEQQTMVAFLAQIEEEGFARLTDDDRLRLSWEGVYELADSTDHRQGLALVGLPPILDWRPKLDSEAGLGDQEFAILLTGWAAPTGERVAGDVRLNGAVVTWKGEESLLSKHAWLTVEAIAIFHRRWLSERNGEGNRRGWARIRKHAVAARADLSHFLRSTVVLTPEKLRLNLRKGELGTRLVEIIPDFAGAPQQWIETFDRGSKVLERYDIPQGEGMVQVMLSPEAQSVLREIKALPGRRVAGARAEAFVRNPFATLGPDANAVLDAEEFERERERAALSLVRFTPELIRDQQGLLLHVALHIAQSFAGPLAETRLRLATVTELEAFVQLLGDGLAQQVQCLAWDEYEFEILGESREHLASLQAAVAEWRRQDQFTLAEILDLSCYSERIEGFGTEKTYYSPFIAKREKASAWFPEEVAYGVLYQPEDGPAVAVSMGEAAVQDLERRLQSARQDGANAVAMPGLPCSLSADEAQGIVASFAAVKKDLAAGMVEEDRLQPVMQQYIRRQLVLRSNVETIDYEERRGALSLGGEEGPALPASLKPECLLKQHQREGFAWLEHLFARSPAECRGALLADDMGLGKTLQILTFIARVLESTPEADPVLIVAPVALLENWLEEMEKFFIAGSLPVLPLFGPVLAGKRLPREALAAEAGQTGLGKLLVRNWLGSARIVLTTYETLRDLEFSFARQRWSVVVCDEAQKIKNPNSMVSRAAKKQNARFKIACTGTPVENSLTDLWCLFDFIQPGLLGSLSSFGTTYTRPIEAKTETEGERLNQLRALIEPQKLRRTKVEVARDLPAKVLVEDCRRLVISPWQRRLYADAVRRYREGVSPQFPAHASVNGKDALSLLLYLRTLCAAPPAKDGQPAGERWLAALTEHSPKLDWLLRELLKIHARAEKAIIFCEVRDLQRTLQRAVHERFGLTPDIINGQTSTAPQHAHGRRQRILEFQQKPGFAAVILSPLAVGFGLNIQAANHVIHFTRSWNPAKEDQATDRAYRIGQTRDVFVYYPVVTAPDFETFDIKLDRLLEKKRALSRDMLNGAGDVLLQDFGKLEAV